MSKTEITNTPEHAYEKFMSEEQQRTTVSTDMDIIRAGLDVLCKQLPVGANLNAAVRIMEALKRVGKHIDEMENAMMAMSDSLGAMAND